MERYLITTADERTWPASKPIMFLGEWCRLYNRKAVWQNLNAEVVPYHWDDRRKLHRDYLYLQGLHEQVLLELTDKLNALHGVEHSLRYWRILVGPWLGYFVQILFDRWTMIERAVRDYSVTGVRVLETPPEQIVPNDMIHFVMFFTEDHWNEAIYCQLLRGWTDVRIEPVSGLEDAHSYTTQELVAGRPAAHSIAHKVKRNLSDAVYCGSQMFTREDEAFLLNTYLFTQQELYLQCRLRQVPKLWRSHLVPRTQVDWTKRHWQLGDSGAGGFPDILRAMIPRHIPALYLEGYTALQACCAALPWPKRPSLIFTCGAHSSDEVFKAWAAAKTEAGAPLVVGQHGGSYGTAKWGFTEDHQIDICDAWLSWGWTDESNPKIRSVANIKMIGNRAGWDPGGSALLVELSLPRYSYHMYSIPVAGQWLDYFEDQCRFVNALPQELRVQLLVRLYRQDYKWCSNERWQDRFPNIMLDDGTAPIASLVRKSRVYISTYNSTTYLESLAMNIPTIMFWNPRHWELRDEAVPYFEKLKAVGIFHETPESAAAKLAEVWAEVAAWWKQPAIQEARNYFCHRFSRTPDNPIQILNEALTTIVKSSTENRRVRPNSSIATV